jgi:photosystem II stability/assembly factor-like uncharacterized protein
VVYDLCKRHAESTRGRVQVMKRIVSVSVTLSILCISCMNTRSGGTALSRLPSPEVRSQMGNREREQVTHVEATLKKSASVDWHVDETKTVGQEDLASVFFLDENHGWAGTRDTLYSTTDGGKSWRRIEIRISKTALVKKIVFTSQNDGWAVVQDQSSDPLKYDANHFWLMRSVDGGNTWTTKQDSKDSVVNELRFADKSEGWFIGTKYTGIKPLRGQDFIFHTTDGGEHWVDVSEPLNQMIGNLPLKLGFTDISPATQLTASVIMSEGNVFTTNDGGRHWQAVSVTIDDFSHVCFCHIGETDNHGIWLGGWRDDRRSLLGMVAWKEADTWREYLLAGVSFLDLLFVSRDGILTSGSTTPNQQGYTEQREAVVTYSADRGATWSFVYRNPKAKRINAISAVDSNHVWAVGDDGLILRLTATTKAD